MNEQATQISGDLAQCLRKDKIQEIATAREMSLLGIEQHILDLVSFRQDAVERLTALRALPNREEAEEEIGDVQSEIDAANLQLQELAGAEVAKVDRCANLLRLCDRMEAHCKDERDRLSAKAKRWHAIKDAVENVVMNALEVTGRTAFDSPTNRLRVQRNGQPRVEIVNPQMVQDRFINVLVRFTVAKWNQIKTALPDLLPEHYEEVERTFNTAAISKALKLAKQEEDAANNTMEGDILLDTIRTIDKGKPRGAQLVYGKHLRVE